MSTEDIERYDNDLFRAHDGKWIKFSDHEYAIQQLQQMLENQACIIRDSCTPANERETRMLQELAELRNTIACAVNALTDSILCSGNEAETNMHFVRKLRDAITSAKTP